jgi:hypothetical protein
VHIAYIFGPFFRAYNPPLLMAILGFQAPPFRIKMECDDFKAKGHKVSFKLGLSLTLRLGNPIGSLFLILDYLIRGFNLKEFKIALWPRT